jgi:hypothetical protein
MRWSKRGFLGRLLVDPDFRQARLWSNDALRPIARLCEGEVVNVSAWKDEDKEGGHYRDYFSRASSYVTSNYGGYRGSSDGQDIELDLESPLPPQFHAAFDVVYNHTTLEHVFDVFTAVRNLCALSRDLVIVVVPFVQKVHTSESFSDYWRFTAPGISRLLESNGLQVVLLASSIGSASSIYHLCVASRHPERWREKLAGLPRSVNHGDGLFRLSPLGELMRHVARALWSR